MILVAKFLFVIIAVFGQEHLFREKPQSAQIESGTGLDSVNLTVDRPELVLAKRAMEDQGLCPADPSHAVAATRIEISPARAAGAKDSTEDLASLCP